MLYNKVNDSIIPNYKVSVAKVFVIFRYTFFEKAGRKTKNGGRNGKKGGRNGKKGGRNWQRKVNKNIYNKVIEREESISNEEKTAEPFHSQIQRFKQETGKYVSDVKVLPIGIDMNLLIDKVKSSKFLMQAKIWH